MKIFCVIENTAKFASEFYAEHGLSILIKYKSYKVLFDTGSTPDVLKKNIKLLNGLEGLKSVVLSHGHNDHTGGLSYVMNNSSADIFMHERAILPKYILRNDKMEFIGTDEVLKTKLTHVLNDDQKNKSETRVELISKTTEIAPNIFILSEISLNNDFEEINPSFYIKDHGKFFIDNFEDEVVLVIKTDQGLLILSGCAHRGIVNTVSSVVEFFNNDDVYAVIGGTHLVSASEDIINKTIKELKKYDPKYLILGHCNGLNAMCMFRNVFENKFEALESGKEIIISME